MASKNQIFFWFSLYIVTFHNSKPPLTKINALPPPNWSLQSSTAFIRTPLISLNHTSYWNKSLIKFLKEYHPFYSFHDILYYSCWCESTGKWASRTRNDYKRFSRSLGQIISHIPNLIFSRGVISQFME